MAAQKKLKTANDLNQDKAIDIFQKVGSYNWDCGYRALERFLKRKDCDRGTALMMYWRAAPIYHARYETADECSNPEAWLFVKTLEKRLLSGKFPALIRYDPASQIENEAKYNDELHVNKIPPELFQISPGELDANDIEEGKIGPRALNTAARNNDVGLLKKILGSGRDINYKCDGRTPFIEAIVSGSADVVSYLITQGVDVHKKVDGLQPINYVHHDAVVNILIDAGVDVNAVVGGSTAIHFAARENGTQDRSSAVMALIAAGAKPDVKNRDGATALHLAAMGGNLRSFKALLAAGWDVNAVDRQQNNMLHYAAGHEHSRMWGKPGRASIFKEIIKQGVSPDELGKATCSPRELVELSNIKPVDKNEILKIMDLSKKE